MQLRFVVLCIYCLLTIWFISSVKNLPPKIGNLYHTYIRILCKLLYYFIYFYSILVCMASRCLARLRNVVRPLPGSWRVAIGYNHNRRVCAVDDPIWMNHLNLDKKRDTKWILWKRLNYKSLSCLREVIQMNTVINNT